MGELFGTDGIRGIANTQLTCELVLKAGKAAAYVLTKAFSHKPVILIGKDTRISSDMLEAALIAGFCSFGADVIKLGVIPTPAVSHFVKTMSADAGVVISASHNSMEYNGIKIFNKDGYKLSDQMENEIEAIIFDDTFVYDTISGEEIGRVSEKSDAKEEYIKYIMSTTDSDLSGMRIAVDCANGSASATAQGLFLGLGADAYFINDTPDGTNINKDCGSTHLDMLSRTVVEGGYDAGVAFDGDADRVLIIDEKGREVDGDMIIAALAADMKERGTLRDDTAVVTIMTNMGFFKFAQENGINTRTTKVGDRYVLEEMLSSGYNLGGEQSGHIILTDYNTTGDGQLSAVQWLSLMKKSGLLASSLGSLMKKFPQVMINVKVSGEGKREFENNTNVADVINKAKLQLGKGGRVIVRASGTEDLVRVMIEGSDEDEISALCGRIAEVIRLEYGV